MPRAIKHEPRKPPGREPVYPWDDWISRAESLCQDGRSLLLEHGKDFHSQPKYFAHTLRQILIDRDFVLGSEGDCRVYVEGSSVILSFC